MARKKSRKPHGAIMGGMDERPGFLIRRAHQISQAVFIQECESLDITATQFGVLSVLMRAGELNQISVARLLGYDRSTTGLVVKLLEDRGMIVRTADPADRRGHVLRLTPSGKTMQRRAAPLVDRVRDRLVEVFTPAEAATFIKLLIKFTRSFEDIERVPPLHRASDD